MKKFNIFIVGILICFLNFNVNAQVKGVTDYSGENWVNMPEDIKLGVVMGFVIASNSIEKDVEVMLQILQWQDEKFYIKKDQDISKRKEFWKLANANMMRIIKKYSIYEIQIGTIFEAIEEFYENTRNRRILIKGAFEYVNMSLQGATDEELKGKVEYLRIFEIPNPDEKKKSDYYDRELPKILKEK